jgi:hypothetical protein
MSVYRRKDNNMDRKQTINVGIGFATGRKNFQRVLRTYISNFKESGVLDDVNINWNTLKEIPRKLF